MCNYATGDVHIVNMQWWIYPQFAGDIIQVVYPQSGPSEAVRHGGGRHTKNLQGEREREKENKRGKKEKRGERKEKGEKGKKGREEQEMY